MRKTLYILLLIIFVLCIDKINAYTEYKVGDEVKYNNVDYYVIKNSGVNEEEVQLLKKDPLTVAQVNQFGAGHVNMYVTQDTSSAYYQQAFNINYSGTDTGIGGMAYYSSATCNQWGDSSGCTTDYSQSEIKYVVDAWKAAQAPNATNARLITLDDLTDNLGMELNRTSPTTYQVTVTEDTPTWVMGENYVYWTMTTNTDKTAYVWYVDTRSNAGVYSDGVQRYRNNAVRPVITLKKTALGDKDESVIVDKDNETVDNKTDTKDNIDDNKSNESKTIVKVANTYMSSSIVIIILGFIIASISILIIYKLSNKKR